MKTLILTITLDGAMQDRNALSAVLSRVAHHVMDSDSGRLYDEDGNQVGQWVMR